MEKLFQSKYRNFENIQTLFNVLCGDYEFIECRCENLIERQSYIDHIDNCSIIKNAEILKDIQKQLKQNYNFYFIILAFVLKQQDNEIHIEGNNKQFDDLNKKDGLGWNDNINDEMIEKMKEEDLQFLKRDELDASSLCHQCFNSFDLNPVNPDYIVLECNHKIHSFCFNDICTKNELFCPQDNCGKLVSEDYLKKSLGKDGQDNQISNKIELLKFQTNIQMVQCPGCKEIIELSEGTAEDIHKLRDDEGNEQNKVTLAHRRKHRLKCKCSYVFCTNCYAHPQHENKTCEQFNIFKTSEKCRYCDEVLNNGNKHSSISCKDEICIDYFKENCSQVNRCGHQCQNQKTTSHTKCMGCLHPSCKPDNNEMSNCLICNFEPLKAKPSIKLQCNHLVHQECLFRIIKSGYSGPRIQFKFLQCFCGTKQNLNQFTQQKELYELLKQWDGVYNETSKKSLERLKIENLDNSNELKDQSKPWYNDKLAYSLKKLAFQMCFKCKKPYFAGLRECGLNVEENLEFKASDAVCGGCCEIKGLGISECPTHKKDQIQWKCKFCCSMAIWFCFGTTHFCDKCHRNHSSVMRKKVHELDQCNGKANCPLKIQHPQNGEAAFAMGCSMCRIDNKQ